MDERLRQLEREAAEGDLVAKRGLRLLRCRQGKHRWGDRFKRAGALRAGRWDPAVYCAVCGMELQVPLVPEWSLECQRWWHFESEKRRGVLERISERVDAMIDVMHDRNDLAETHPEVLLEPWPWEVEEWRA